MTPRPNPWLPALAALGVAVLGVASGRAQTAPTVEPEQLKAYRAAFQKQIAEATRTAEARDGDELAKFEQQMAAKGVYDAAIAAKQRRLALGASKEVEAPPVQVLAGDPPGTIQLEMSRARFSASGVSYDRGVRALVGWRNPNVSAKWEVFGVKPGDYEVVVTYGCRSKSYSSSSYSYRYAGGTFDVKEQTRLVEGSKALSHSVASTGGWDKKVERTLGALKITGTSTSIVLTARSAQPLGLMYLYGIKLIPTARPAEAAPEAETDPGEPTALAKVRAAYGESLATIATPVLAEYITRLTALEIAFAKTGQIDKAKAVRAEKVRAEQQLGDPASLVVLTPPPAPEASLAASVGIEALEKRHTENLAQAQRALLAPYDAALARLQETLTTATKLEQALMVRQERQRVSALHASR